MRNIILIKTIYENMGEVKKKQSMKIKDSFLFTTTASVSRSMPGV